MGTWLHSAMCVMDTHMGIKAFTLHATAYAAELRNAVMQKLLSVCDWAALHAIPLL